MLLKSFVFLVRRREKRRSFGIPSDRPGRGGAGSGLGLVDKVQRVILTSEEKDSKNSTSPSPHTNPDNRRLDDLKALPDAA
ncbi:hypothetical protein EYF80_048485 [Liparis tanakae]|uniref:Uncharacterized protein n=1 Tax=Liparis tanakae TaxID=230148 RepID=A0A4Z2FK70_9TELE|nr:hypothetical protein EYF80_048485 [Liparis tanakae]